MPAALSLATATILMVAPSRNFLEIYPHSPRSTEPPGMYEGVGESGIRLLACCCTPTVGPCILSWANISPLSL